MVQQGITTGLDPEVSSAGSQNSGAERRSHRTHQPAAFSFPSTWASNMSETFSARTGARARVAARHPAARSRCVDWRCVSRSPPRHARTRPSRTSTAPTALPNTRRRHPERGDRTLLGHAHRRRVGTSVSRALTRATSSGSWARAGNVVIRRCRAQVACGQLQQHRFRRSLGQRVRADQGRPTTIINQQLAQVRPTSQAQRAAITGVVQTIKALDFLM